MKIQKFSELEGGAAQSLKKPLTVRMSIPMLAHLELLSTLSGTTRNQLIRQSIFEFLQRNGVKDPHKY